MKEQLCLAHGCDKVVTPGRVMCRYHWRLVPRELQEDLAEQAGHAGRPGRFLAAARRAIVAVKHLEDIDRVLAADHGGEAGGA